jgi:hypothetical protein
MFYKFIQNFENLIMKKSFVILMLFAAMIIASLAFTADEPRYKNLKILPKNITKQQMDSVMRHFTGSLGVKCNFCHTYNEQAKAMDWASDANKHKLVTRQMMTMTNKLNKKYFDVSGKQNLDAKLLVTCYTCHHGATHPEVKAPHQERPQGPPPPPTGPRLNRDTTKQR